MSQIGQRYAMPAEIDRYVDEGLLELSMEQPDKMTVDFHIPSSRSTDHRGRITVYGIKWIHPDYDAEFCECYDDTPGDLPNFSVEICISDGPPKIIDELETVDDLEAWLEDFRFIGKNLRHDPN